MLQTKIPTLQFNQNSPTFQTLPNQTPLKIKRCHSSQIQPAFKLSIDLSVQRKQSFVCFECGNVPKSRPCFQCKGQGFLDSDHPMVQLMNDIFNAKYIPEYKNQQNKPLVSTKSSSNSNISDLIVNSQVPNGEKHRNSKSTQKNQKNSLFQMILAPLQSIIKEESGMQQKIHKCNICHYQFDGVKYTCSYCQNYNVCELCYKTKRINHGHELKKIHSTNSQQNGLPNCNSQSNIAEQNAEGQNQETDNTHSDVARLSLKSNESVEEIFKEMANVAQELKCESKLTKPTEKENGSSFFKLIQIQNSQKSPKSSKECQNCHMKIQECYWICQSCVTMNQNYEICKDCYDKQTYSHPSGHQLGLNFFSLDQSFFEPENKFFIENKSDIYQDNDRYILRDSQLRNGKPLSMLVQSSETQEDKQMKKNQRDVSSIGVIGYRDIFAGFHKGSGDQQIISPIPKSIALTHSFKDKNRAKSNESDNQITELIAGSSNTEKKENSIGKEKQSLLFVGKQKFMDQSRVEFDEQMIELAMSNEYDSRKLLTNSERKPSPRLNDSVSMIHNVSEINPETSIMEIAHQDFLFVNYRCDICGCDPIKNVKYHCRECEDYDICQECYGNRRLQHWHQHWRKDDGKMKSKRVKLNKQKAIKKAIDDINTPYSPMRKSVRFIK